MKDGPNEDIWPLTQPILVTITTVQAGAVKSLDGKLTYANFII